MILPTSRVGSLHREPKRIMARMMNKNTTKQRLQNIIAEPHTMTTTMTAITIRMMIWWSIRTMRAIWNRTFRLSKKSKVCSSHPKCPAMWSDFVKFNIFLPDHSTDSRKAINNDNSNLSADITPLIQPKTEKLQENAVRHEEESGGTIHSVEEWWKRVAVHLVWYFF